MIQNLFQLQNDNFLIGARIIEICLFCFQISSKMYCIDTSFFQKKKEMPHIEKTFKLCTYRPIQISKFNEKKTVLVLIFLTSFKHRLVSQNLFSPGNHILHILLKDYSFDCLIVNKQCLNRLVRNHNILVAVMFS